MNWLKKIFPSNKYGTYPFQECVLITMQRYEDLKEEVSSKRISDQVHKKAVDIYMKKHDLVFVYKEYPNIPEIMKREDWEKSPEGIAEKQKLEKSREFIKNQYKQ